MPEAMIHPPPAELTAFGLGKLSDAAAAAIARHLEACPSCRQAVEDQPSDSFIGKVHAAKPGGSSVPPTKGLTQASSAPAAGVVPSDLPAELHSHPKYRVVRELGRGGMGVVYQAVQTIMDRSVALKVISPSLLSAPDALPRFQAEVRAAAKLDHPNIVRAHDADHVGDLHLLVMEFVEGVTLADRVKQRGPLPIIHACHYVRQAALGLQHAFERGMAHRDIKPQNLMLTPRGQIKILDFGLARRRSDGTSRRRLTH